ncbi:filamentous hemagglutinin N-terminal domain-containing protein, partial [Herbaspirillum seropedicae]|uniref:two-partner secretion domain-containing protein n=1 Tax=Herbaspirillum seropedicae TaxID=964 RepID=UPI0031D59C3F
MNKLRYRVIFNKTRGLLMAVSELGRSHSAGTLDGGQPGQTAPLAAARLHPLAFAVMVLAGAQLLCMPLARAQIVADPSAPRAQQPVVLPTANGLPQVNITTPSAAGVSRNTYSQFDVNKPGAILNNSRADVQTQLGGWIQRNPNLANGTARVILNEVNSSNPSFLRGYVEVAGDRAQVIIANPAGVTCDGCGFINASRTTLSTGAALMNNGNLDGFVVQRGTVTIQGDGLDASRSDYTDIIARAVRVNAGIWSKELRVSTGANRVDSDNRVIQKQTADSNVPSFAIDVAQLGGMYANKIILVGTEAGVGVSNGGSIGAAAGEVRISADGRIQNTGKIQSAQTVDVTATGLDNRSGAIQAVSKIDVRLGGGALNNDGGLIKGSDSVTVQAGSLSNQDTRDDKLGILGKTVSVEADQIDNQRGKLRADDSIAITAAGTVDNSAGAISAGGAVSINDRNADPAARTLSVLNRGGLVETSATLAVKAASLANTDTGGADQGLRARAITLDADRIDNTRGAVLANDSATLTGSATVDNSAGTISAGGALRIADRNAGSADASRTLVVTNTGGKLDAATSNTIDSAALSGDGQVLSQQSTTVRLTSNFSNTGTVRGNGSVDVESTGAISNDGQMQAATTLRIKAPTIMNGATGTLVGNRLELNATDAHTLVNRGLIDGQDTFILTQTLRNLGTGRIYGDHIAIAATTVDNEAESINGVSSAPVIAARDRLDIGAENVNNREHAMLFAAGDMAIGGALDSNNRATGQAGTVNNNSATIEAQGALDLAARTINNTNEHFSTEIVEVSRENKREFQYSGSGTRYDQSQVAIINDEADDMWLRNASGTPVTKLGNDFNRYDYVRVIQESRVSQTDPGKIISARGMRISAGVVNNDKSQIIAGGNLDGAIGTLNNTEVAGQRNITGSGIAYHFFNIEKKGRDEQGVSATGYYPGAVVQAISLTPTVYQQN